MLLTCTRLVASVGAVEALVGRVVVITATSISNETSLPLLEMITTRWLNKFIHFINFGFRKKLVVMPLIGVYGSGKLLRLLH